MGLNFYFWAWILSPKICTRIRFFVWADFRKPPVALVPHNSPLPDAQNTFSWTWWRYFEHLTTPGVTEQKLLLFAWAKLTAHHTNFKKYVLSKSGQSGALLGLNFRFFLTSLWPSDGSRRLKRATMTHIGQQYPPGPLKLLGLREKNKQKYRCWFCLKKMIFEMHILWPRAIGIHASNNPSHEEVNSNCRHGWFFRNHFSVTASKMTPMTLKKWSRKTRPAFLYNLW
jgi:hypothetical protein